MDTQTVKQEEQVVVVADRATMGICGNISGRVDGPRIGTVRVGAVGAAEGICRNILSSEGPLGGRLSGHHSRKTHRIPCYVT